RTHGWKPQPRVSRLGDGIAHGATLQDRGEARQIDGETNPTERCQLCCPVEREVENHRCVLLRREAGRLQHLRFPSLTARGGCGRGRWVMHLSCAPPPMSCQNRSQQALASGVLSPAVGGFPASSAAVTKE